MCSNFLKYLGFCWTGEDQIHNGATLSVSYPTLPVDALGSEVAGASAGIVLTPKPEYPYPASEGLIFFKTFNENNSIILDEFTLLSWNKNARL